MELPHLTLFLRRLSAPPPPGSGLRAALRTPRVKYALTWALWTMAALFALIDPDALAPQFSSRGGWGWFYDLNDVFEAAISFCGNFWVYLLIAVVANDLAADPGESKWPRLALPTLPAWFSTPLPSANALWATGLSALVTIAPVLCGLLACLALAQSGHVYAGLSTDDAADVWRGFWWMNLAAVLRLPQFFLACCCIALALRRTPLRQLLPVCLALLATATALVYPLTQASDYITLAATPTPGINPSLLYAAAGLAALLYAFAASCIRLAGGQDGPRAAGFWLVLLLAGGMLLLGVHEISATWRQTWMPIALSSIHGFYAALLPDVQVFNPSPWGLGYYAYGLFMRPLTAVLQAGLAWAATLAFWIWAAVSCLDAARGLVARRSGM